MILKDKYGSSLNFYQAKNGKIYANFADNFSWEIPYKKAEKLPIEIIEDIEKFNFAYGKTTTGEDIKIPHRFEN